MGIFNKVKIIVIGPPESGKTTIANFLSNSSVTIGGIYRPTKGVRILEFEVDGVSLGGNQSASIDVVLWDCSGAHRFEFCWPSMQRDANGIVFVYDPENSKQLKDLESWHLHFAKSIGVKDKQCMIMAHQKPKVSATGQVSGIMSRMSLITSNLDMDPNAVRDEFRKFLSNVVAHINDRRDKEELSILE